MGERYEPGEPGSADGRAGRVAAELAREGRPARHVGRIHAPDEELALYLFEADAPETVAEIGRRAAIPFDRIWPAVWTCSAASVNPSLEEAT